MRTASVSAIVPCFSCSGTIRRAVASIADQTLLPAEVILIDDGSADDTPAVLDELRCEYGCEWLKVLRLDVNRGAASARNAGWSVATQDYIAFLDADDVWHPRKVEVQYSWMADRPGVGLSGHGIHMASDGTLLRDTVSQIVRVRPWRLLMGNVLPTPTVMLRRDLPFRFAAGKRHSEDYLLWLTVVLNGWPIYRFDAPLAGIFKPAWGAGGLSGDLWAMEKGELYAYRELWSNGLIRTPTFTGLAAVSLAKFSRRAFLKHVRHRLP